MSQRRSLLEDLDMFLTLNERVIANLDVRNLDVLTSNERFRYVEVLCAIAQRIRDYLASLGVKC